MTLEPFSTLILKLTIDREMADSSLYSVLVEKTDILHISFSFRLHVCVSVSECVCVSVCECICVCGVC